MSEPKRNKLKIPESPSPQTEVEEPVIVEKVKTKKTTAEKVTRPANGKEKSVAPTKPKVSLKERFAKFLSFYNNERTQKVLGLLLILGGVYLAIAFASFVFTWKEDQDKVLGPASQFFSNETKVQNWLGKVGALISHLFMFKWFGMSSFLLVPVLFVAGLKRLISKDFTFFKKVNYSILFFLFFTPVALGFFFTDHFLFMGGGLGYVINQKLSAIIGSAGTIALLAVTLLGYLVIAFNFSFERKKITEEDPDSYREEEENIVQNETITVPNKLKVTEDRSEPELTPEEEEELMNIELVTPSTNSEPVEREEEQIEEETNEIPLEIEPASIEKKTGEIDFVVEAPKKEEVFEENEPEEKAKHLVEQFGEFDPTLDLGSYQFPTLDLLQNFGHVETKVNQEELNGNKNRIIDTLKNYGIEIASIKATVGPTVTLYEIVPAAGVRISKIKNLEDDIALSLSALGIRIIAPIPGKGTIGIEVPNQTPEMVPMRNVIGSEKFQNSTFDLPIALGKTINNETFVVDLAKMPHLLMAGATGQGKSVGLNAVLVSLLYKKHPAQIKFVLVDPKKVELTLFNKIERHFLAKLPNSEDAIITDNTKVIHTLNSLCIEMDNRYALLQDAQVRNIKEYNTKFVARKLNPNEGHKYLPYIVLVVDEFADLIMTAGKEVETPIARLAQLARAIGIHLILATQRPSVNIITGSIKANFPARIAFRVTSKIDSRTILDSGGAEQLIGRGDMLLSTGNDLIRIQCAFVDTPEVEKITDFIGRQRAYPSAFMLPEYVGEDGDTGKDDVDLSERDKMFDDAARIIVQHQQGSASLLQRKLKLGYNRAGRIVDQLEAAGIIGPFEGSKAREVLIKDAVRLDEILKNLKENH
ncbi:MAG: DNA translocase FtsK 4TM domain-containing protein [Bacteroidota bacterium]|nr:DNA translocase FtsK 4TM domain-containing protein [Bacteroidota bacterium]